MSLRLSRAVVACLAVVSLSAASCTTSSTTKLTPREKDIRSTDTNVKHNDCGAECTGTIDGAKYTIKLPQRWNGTLLIYSHGYRFATPAPPNFSPVVTHAAVSSSDIDGSGSDPLSQRLLGLGYALAGSAFTSNGWAVADGVKEAKALYEDFVQLVGKPKRTYVWGDSLGGLISEVIAEKNPDWVDGAAPMCGAVAGPILNFNLALDVATAVKALIDPTFKVANYRSAEEANDNWLHAEHALIQAASDTTHGGTARVLYIAALVNAPSQTELFDGHDPVSQVKAQVEGILTALEFGTAARYELEQRVGGNVSDNSATDYAARISPSEAAVIGLVKGDTVASMDAKMAKAPRLKADSAAVNKAEALGDTTGEINAPTLTLHTVADPLVIAQNEYVLSERAVKAGRATKLVDAFIKPPITYATKAPYGAGHCNFNDDQRVGLIKALDRWVRTGDVPLPDALSADLGEGYDYGFVPSAWPASTQ